MQKGGDLYEKRGNRKTVGAKPWYKITADSVRTHVDAWLGHPSIHPFVRSFMAGWMYLVWARLSIRLRY